MQRLVERVGFRVVALGENGYAPGPFVHESPFGFPDQSPCHPSSTIQGPDGQMVKMPSPAIPAGDNGSYYLSVTPRYQEIIIETRNKSLDLV